MNIDECGNRVWRNPAGQLHRTDGPAIEWANGGKDWWVNGKCHRTDGPAIEWSNGTKEWWLNGQLHRMDGPAIEAANGTKEWRVNDRRTSKQIISYLSSQLHLKVLLLSRVVNPFCEINVAKYVL